MADIGMNLNYFERSKLPANEGSLGGEKYINYRYIRQNSLNISRPKLLAVARSLGCEIYRLIGLNSMKSIAGRYTCSCLYQKGTQIIMLSEESLQCWVGGKGGAHTALVNGSKN